MKSLKQKNINILESEWINIKKFWSKLVRPSKEQMFTSFKFQAAGIGLVGIVGYVIKLVHIPINNILVNKPN